MPLITNKEYLISGLIVATGFAAPVIPYSVLQLLDNIVVRVLVVVGLLYAITEGYLYGLAALVAIGLLFIERNRHKVARARTKFERILEASDSPQMTVEQEGVPQNTVPVKEFDEASDTESIFLPGKATGSDMFERVPWSENLNGKWPLQTVPIGNKSAPLFKNLLN